MERVAFDSYVIDSLMPDLVGHDRRASAFVVYVYLWRRTRGGTRGASASLQMIADGTGLSKGAVQAAVKWLAGRHLLATKRSSATAAPVFTLACHWRGR
jgi:hypothetical protein